MGDDTRVERGANNRRSEGLFRLVDGSVSCLYTGVGYGVGANGLARY